MLEDGGITRRPARAFLPRALSRGVRAGDGALLRALREGTPVRTTIDDGVKALELAEAATTFVAREGIDRSSSDARHRTDPGCGSAYVGWAARRSATRENLAARVPGATLVAACSPVAAELEWARNALGVRRCTRTTRRCSRDPDVDAVFLVTPTTLHADADHRGAARRQARVLREAAVARRSANASRVEAEAATASRISR